MTLGFDLVVSSNSGMSSFSLLLDEAVVLPKLGAKGVIVSGVLFDVNSIITEVLFALVFAVDGSSSSQMGLMIIKDIVGGVVDEDTSTHKLSFLAFSAPCVGESPSD